MSGAGGGSGVGEMGWPRVALTSPLLRRRLPAAGGRAWGGCPRPRADLCQPHHQPGVCRQGETGPSTWAAPLAPPQLCLGSGTRQGWQKEGSWHLSCRLAARENQCLKMASRPVTQATPGNPGQPGLSPQVWVGSDKGWPHCTGGQGPGARGTAENWGLQSELMLTCWVTRARPLSPGMTNASL